MTLEQTRKNALSQNGDLWGIHPSKMLKIIEHNNYILHITKFIPMSAMQFFKLSPFAILRMFFQALHYIFYQVCLHELNF